MNVRGGRWSFLLVLPLLALAVGMIWWRGPDWRVVHDAFTVVRWPWVVAAIGLNLLSVIVRALCWETTIMQSIPKPHPRFRLIFSAFSVGLFANAVLPGRVGELARVAVLRRRLPGHGKGTTATLIGSVFAHRMFDLFPAVTLVIWVLLAAKIPAWAVTAIAIVLGRRRAAVSRRVGQRAHPAPRCARRARHAAADADAGARGPRGDARAAARGVGGHLPVRRLDVPAARGVGDDARVPHLQAARRRGARARADQRRDDLPALARQRRPRADRGRDAARQLRRRLRARRRVRDRPAGDRGVGRRRGRPGLPGA